MSKRTFKYYWVEALTEDDGVSLVKNTYNEKTNEYYHEFLYKKDAKKLLEDEKKFSPDVRFRLASRTEVYEEGTWV